MDYPEQILAVDELERRFERLRSLYEQYFLGIEKLEPFVQRKDVDRRLWLLRKETIRNTGLRFRFQQVVSRYNTFATHWQRVTREIENGTFRRDVARANRRFGGSAPEPPDPSPSMVATADGPSPPPRPGAPPPEAAGARTHKAADLPDQRMKELYAQYVSAKRQCSESTADITFERMSQTLQEASGKLRQKHPAGSIDFEVVVRDGRAILKPVVRGL